MISLRSSEWRHSKRTQKRAPGQWNSDVYSCPYDVPMGLRTPSQVIRHTGRSYNPLTPRMNWCMTVLCVTTSMRNIKSKPATVVRRSAIEHKKIGVAGQQRSPLRNQQGLHIIHNGICCCSCYTVAPMAHRVSSILASHATHAVVSNISL